MAGFEIDGEVYEVPRLDTFDMDEAQILYDLSGIVLEDFIPPHPDDTEEEREALLTLQMARVRNPSFRRALVVVAYVRSNPDAVPEEVSQRVGKINAVDVTLAVLTRRGDDEEDPSTSSPKLPDVRSSENETSPQSSSGSHSGSVSAARVVSLPPTGTSSSDTSSPALLETASGS